MRRLTALKNGVLKAVEKHAADTYPEECCGFLYGYEKKEGVEVVLSQSVDNLRKTNRDTRYRITPAEYMKAEKLAEESSFQLLGVYHSHPDHPAAPSAYDLEWALPGFVYLIVSVLGGVVGASRWWELSPDRSMFIETKPVKEEFKEVRS